MLENVVEAGGFLLDEFLGRQGHPLGGILGLQAPPSRQVTAVEQGREAVLLRQTGLAAGFSVCATVLRGGAAEREQGETCCNQDR